MPDALGSVTMANDGSNDNAATYTPYGRGGAASWATFGWVGASGYHPTGKDIASHYLRYSHYDKGNGPLNFSDLTTGQVIIRLARIREGKP